MPISLSAWTRCYILTICCIALWLAAIAPTGKLGKGVFLFLGLTSSIQLIKESRQLIFEQAMNIAREAMHQELAQAGLALETYQAEQELQQMYLGDTSQPEVKEELIKSLESLYQEDIALERTVTSTSISRNLYLAVTSLLSAGKSETFIIEEVLKMGGRQWDDGKAMLKQILEDGDVNGW